MANRTVMTADLDIPADVFREAKEAGPNDRGMYTLRASFWPNERRTSDKSPQFTGQVQVKGKTDGAKGFSSLWQNNDEAPRSSKPAFNDDPF